MSVLKLRGYRFDGINDSVQLPLLGLPSSASGIGWTAEAWINIDPVLAQARPLVFPVLQLRIEPNGTLRLEQSDGVFGPTALTPANVVAGTGWRHVALTLLGQVTSLWLDGVVIASQTTARAAGSGDPFIGGNAFGSSLSATMMVRDVRVWNRALAAAEMALFRPTLRGDEPGLVGWWPLDPGHDTLDRTIRPLSRVLDRFRDPAGTSLNGKAAETGQVWSVLTGSVTVQGGKARTGGAAAVAVLESGMSEVEVSGRCDGVGSNLVFRAVDAANRFFLDCAGGVTNIYRVQTGATTQILFDTTSFAAGDLMSVRAVGSLLSVYKNGVFVKSVTDAFSSSSTLHGVAGAGGGQEMGDFSVTPIGGPSGARHGAPKNGARLSMLKAVA